MFAILGRQTKSSDKVGKRQRLADFNEVGDLSSKCCQNEAYGHDVTSAILVSINKVTLFLSEPNQSGVKFRLYGKNCVLVQYQVLRSRFVLVFCFILLSAFGAKCRVEW